MFQPFSVAFYSSNFCQWTRIFNKVTNYIQAHCEGRGGRCPALLGLLMLLASIPPTSRLDPCGTHASHSTPQELPQPSSYYIILLLLLHQLLCPLMICDIVSSPWESLIGFFLTSLYSLLGHSPHLVSASLNLFPQLLNVSMFWV